MRRTSDNILNRLLLFAVYMQTFLPTFLVLTLYVAPKHRESGRVSDDGKSLSLFRSTSFIGDGLYTTMALNYLRTGVRTCPSV